MILKLNRERIAVIVGALILSSLIGMPKVYADLVLDSQELQNNTSVDQSRAMERENFRGVTQAGRKAEITVQQEAAVQQPVMSAPVQVQPQPVQQIQVAPQTQVMMAPVATISAVQAAPTQTLVPTSDGGAVEVQHLSKSELLRRKRVREELRNEDILQERLEELRLRDEQKRTDQLISNAGMGAQLQAANPNSELTAVAAQPQTTLIGTAQAPVAVTPAPVPPATALPPSSSVERISTSQASSLDASELDKGTSFSVSPKAGISNINGIQDFDVTPHFSAGVGLGMNASDSVSIELGWMYSEFGVKTGSSNTNSYVTQYQYSNPNTANNSNFESMSLKQNVFDLGMKLALLGPDSKIRPFIGLGAAYSKSYLNYDKQVIDYLNQTGASSLAGDYEVDQYLGAISAGFDVKLSRHLSMGFTGKYYTVLSSRENTANGNTTSAANYGPYGYTTSSQDKQNVGGTISKQSFYSLLAGISFSF